MFNDKLIVTCAASALVTLLVGYIGYIGYAALTAKKYLFRSKVKKLKFYPIKSLPGVEVDHLEIMPSCCGYKTFLDRSWVLLDEENRFMTLRNVPSLYKIKVSLLEDDILLEAHNMPSIKIPNTQPLKKGDLILTTNMWKEEIDGQDCGEKVNSWFSKFLGKPVKLIKHHKQLGYRRTKTNVNDELKMVDGMPILYQDAAPINIMNDKSVKEINKLIKKDYGHENPAYVEIDRFRPNIYIETDCAFEEDDWKYIKINNTEYRFLVENGRCKLTTLNLDTLEYEKEPLRSLKKYRSDPRKKLFDSPKLGIYVKPIQAGVIRVGDDLMASF